MIWVLPHLHTCCRFCIFGLQFTRSGYRNSTFRIILCSGNRRLCPVLVITITAYICTFRVNWDYVIALCIECSNNFYTDCCWKLTHFEHPPWFLCYTKDTKDFLIFNKYFPHIIFLEPIRVDTGSITDNKKPANHWKCNGLRVCHLWHALRDSNPRPSGP